jgi:hypothetical protein
LQKGGGYLKFCKRGDIWGFAKGGDILAFGKGGDIPRLFSDRMPERIACRQVSENSRTFPPLKKGGQGGFLLPDKSSPSPLPFLPFFKSPEKHPRIPSASRIDPRKERRKRDLSRRKQNLCQMVVFFRLTGISFS